MQVKSLRSFDHHGDRKKQTTFGVSEATGRALVKKGLVSVVTESPRANDKSEEVTKAPRRRSTKK